MLVRTELAGYGHYVVCTIIPRVILEKVVELLLVSSLAKDWENKEFDHSAPTGCTGFGNSLYIETKDESDPEVKLIWYPHRLAKALDSAWLLQKIAYVLKYDNPSWKSLNPGLMSLEVSAGESSGPGWFARANFSEAVWDVIESPSFPGLIPAINRDIQNWWEDQRGCRVRGQYLTFFQGRDGPTIHVYQPDGNGLWIEGSRQTNTDYQLCDHNTDCFRHAFIHVLSLCIVLDHCRRAVNKEVK